MPHNAGIRPQHRRSELHASSACTLDGLGDVVLARDSVLAHTGTSGALPHPDDEAIVNRYSFRIGLSSLRRRRRPFGYRIQISLTLSDWSDHKLGVGRGMPSVRERELRFRPWRLTARGQRPRSLWLDQALAREQSHDEKHLEGTIRTDVCLIGGGFTGLWTAIRLREADPSVAVVLLEADICGSGASGRNSGGVGHFWTKLPTLVKALGRDDALALVSSSVDAISDITSFVETHDVDCQVRHGPTVWGATTPNQIGAWQGILEVARKIGVETPYRELSDEELKEMFGPAPYLAGVIQEGGTGVQPALLARGLRQVAIDLGVEIFESTPVTAVISQPRHVAVHTEKGRVDADHVVLGANAWMAHLPDFKRRIMVLSSDVVATDPIPDLIAERGLANRPNAINSRLMLNYGGRSRDGRIYLGRAGGTLAFNARITPEFDRSARQAREIEADFRFLYPQLLDIPIKHSWSGAVDRSPTGLPWFGRLQHDPRLHFGIGYTGHGVSATVTGGHILASLVLQKDDEWVALNELFGRMCTGSFPPEPIRFVGGRIVRRSLARKEVAEREGRPVSRIDRSLARFAPGTFVELRRSRPRSAAGRANST
jgi:glycine/D-amino acid oxidase-like deaminating enzyme